MSIWNGKKVMVTGGAGFLGSHIVDRLAHKGCEVLVPRKKDWDFTDCHATEKYFKHFGPHIVIHCAAFYGGIWINQLYPGKIYYENLVMGAHLMEASRLSGVEKFVGIGTACSYPGYLENYLKEENLWDGPLHESVVNYGLTKKMMAVQGWAYKKQYGFNSLHLILTNLYGPRDTFNPDRSHVVPALIRKFVEADIEKAPEVEVWGTGKPIREFLYVDDCAEAIILATERYDDLVPLNIGTGIGTEIRELVEAIREIVKFGGAIRWNTEKPDGQYKKILDVSRMREALCWEPPTNLREGLEKTIAWYRENKESADKRL
ncbi:MAG: GDP-L-fucose synthase [Candidatus Eremiobacteraeota bacterium]|nr:GDP-L-fucose synthase [Candidatus Eremiobacteraeota bacterium]